MEPRGVRGSCVAARVRDAIPRRHIFDACGDESRGAANLLCGGCVRRGNRIELPGGVARRRRAVRGGLTALPDIEKSVRAGEGSAAAPLQALTRAELGSGMVTSGESRRSAAATYRRAMHQIALLLLALPLAGCGGENGARLANVRPCPDEAGRRRKEPAADAVESRGRRNARGTRLRRSARIHASRPRRKPRGCPFLPRQGRPRRLRAPLRRRIAPHGATAVSPALAAASRAERAASLVNAAAGRAEASRRRLLRLNYPVRSYVTC